MEQHKEQKRTQVQAGDILLRPESISIICHLFGSKLLTLKELDGIFISFVTFLLHRIPSVAPETKRQLAYDDPH